MEEYNSSNTLQADYVMGSRIDEPLIMTRSSTTYYYNSDGLGSVRQVLNSSGTIVESYDYDPYGQVTIYNSSLTDITSSGSGIGNPYMFTGRRFDEETGIYHYRARQYDPAIGRFLQRDPLGYYDSMNLYQYVGRNPVNWIDPLGLKIFEIDSPIGEIVVETDSNGDFVGASGPLNTDRPTGSTIGDIWIPGGTDIGITAGPNGGFSIGTSNPIWLGPFGPTVSNFDFNRGGEFLESDLSWPYLPDWIDWIAEPFVRDVFWEYQDYLELISPLIDFFNRADGEGWMELMCTNEGEP